MIGPDLIETAVQDLRFAWRQLYRMPGLTILAVVTLALGIGANTAMFTAVESVLLRPLPYANPDRLVYIGPAESEAFAPTSWLNYRNIRDQAHTLERVAAYSEDVGVVQSQDASLSVPAPAVTPDLFRMLGARPLLGRVFTEAEGSAGGPQVAVISEGFWSQVFDRDPAVLGRTVRVNGRERTIVGVMPRTFRFPESLGQDIQKGLWLPLQPTPEMLKDRGFDFLQIVAALKPAATIAQSRTDLDVVAQRIRRSDSQSGQNLAFRVTPYHEMITGQVRPVFLALSAALGLVLLIACANVANLLIARCLGRQQEFAVRAALGAGRRHLIRLVVAEGALLSALGCALGLALACIVMAAIHKLPPDTIPRAESIGVHWSVLLLLGAIATVTIMLSSILPAFFVARTDPQPALQSASKGVGTKAVRAKVSGWLIAGEVALSAILLVATGLLFRTLWNLEHTSLGFDSTRVISFTAMPADAAGFGGLGVSAGSPNAAASVVTRVYEPVLYDLRSGPGILHAALITAPPFSGIDVRASFSIAGRSKEKGHPLEARLTAVSGGYAQLMGTPVIRGREISAEDSASAPYVAVVSEALARKYFPLEDPLGRQVDLGGKETGMLKSYTIVGIVGDQVDTSPSQTPRPLLMLSYQQIPPASLFYSALLSTTVHFVVKSRDDPALASEMRTIFHRRAPDFALDNFQTMQHAVDQSNFGARLGLYLVGTFAGLALLMVMAGLYGVLARVVGQRRREIGLRLALGATPQGILRMFLLQATRVVAVGLAVGIALALCTSRLLTSFLYGVKSLDAGSYFFAVTALFVLGIVAALVPAGRAAAVEPMKTLREQ